MCFLLSENQVLPSQPCVVRCPHIVVVVVFVVVIIIAVIRSERQPLEGRIIGQVELTQRLHTRQHTETQTHKRFKTTHRVLCVSSVSPRRKGNVQTHAQLVSR